jgi:membrane protease YdiL (CAAX protease family)
MLASLESRVGRRAGGAFVLSVVLVVYGNLVALPPSDIRVRFLLFTNLALLAAILWVAVGRSRLGREELGLGGRTLVRSSAWGILIGAALALVPVAFIVLAPYVTGEPIEYGDITEFSRREIAVRLGFTIPVRTALFEELAFRGVLYAYFLRAFAPASTRGAGGGGLSDLVSGARSADGRAILWSSFVFMLWHVVISTRTVADSNVVDSLWLVPPAVLVALAGTFIGGLVFAWLRWRTGSAAGPLFVHWLTVALMSLAAWLRA